MRQEVISDKRERFRHLGQAEFTGCLESCKGNKIKAS